MSKVVITIDDAEGGEFSSTICYEQGFNIDSPAHCTGLMLMKHLNTLAEPKGEERVWGGAPSALTPVAAAVNGALNG